MSSPDELERGPTVGDVLHDREVLLDANVPDREVADQEHLARSHAAQGRARRCDDAVTGRLGCEHRDDRG